MYWANGNELVYYYDDHPELENQLQILENLRLINDITYNNAKRYVMTEELADYLAVSPPNPRPQADAGGTA